MPTATPRPLTYRVDPRRVAPLIAFIEHAVSTSGHLLVARPAPDQFPLRFVIETRHGERVGVVAYAFPIVSLHGGNMLSFSAELPAKSGCLGELWQDDTGLYITLLMGIDVARKVFVGADPVLHSPLESVVSFEIDCELIDVIQRSRWLAWEYEREEAPIEILIGAGPETFLRYVLFEREAVGEDQGHRHLLADRAARRFS